MNALEHSIQILGGQTHLARAIGTKQGHIWTWLNRDGGRVPLDRCAAVEAATAGKVPCEALRPDVQWLRDADGSVIGYQVSVNPPALQRHFETAATASVPPSKVA